MVPSGVLGMPGVPAAAQISDAAGIPRPKPQHIPISEQEPPENWPGWAKSLFKIGRGEMTVIAGTAGLAKKAYDDPEKIPGAFADVGEAAYHDPLGTGKALIGYDELANGRWEDWMGQMGFGVLAGGGTATAVSRGTRLPRIVGVAEDPAARAERARVGSCVRRPAAGLQQARPRRAPELGLARHRATEPGRPRARVPERRALFPRRLPDLHAVCEGHRRTSTDSTGT